ncbi:hypothetical protein GOP47_0004587, partial [Adiantum capillus-veneris]
WGLGKRGGGSNAGWALWKAWRAERRRVCHTTTIEEKDGVLSGKASFTNKASLAGTAIGVWGLEPAVDAWPSKEVAAYGDDGFVRDVEANVAGEAASLTMMGLFMGRDFPFCDRSRRLMWVIKSTATNINAKRERNQNSIKKNSLYVFTTPSHSQFMFELAISFTVYEHLQLCYITLLHFGRLLHLCYGKSAPGRFPYSNGYVLPNQWATWLCPLS